jgi:hypothetical protein
MVMSYRFADSLWAGSGWNWFGSAAGGVLSWSCLQAVSKPVWHIPLLCVQWKTPDDGQRNCPKHVEFYSENKFEKLVHLTGFIIRLYHGARSPERQIQLYTYTEQRKHPQFYCIVTRMWTYNVLGPLDSLQSIKCQIQWFYHISLYCYLYTKCMLVWRHSGDGCRSDWNMLVKNSNMWLNMFVNVHGIGSLFLYSCVRWWFTDKLLYLFECKMRFFPLKFGAQMCEVV